MRQTILVEISARPKKQESKHGMMAFMALRVVQGLSLGIRDPSWYSLPLLVSLIHVSQAGTETRRKTYKGDQREIHSGATRPWLPESGKGSLLTIQWPGR